MAKKNKLWFSGEDAQLAARFTKFMTKVLYARRASYIRALMVKAKHEISIEECRDEGEAPPIDKVDFDGILKDNIEISGELKKNYDQFVSDGKGSKSTCTSWRRKSARL